MSKDDFLHNRFQILQEREIQNGENFQNPVSRNNFAESSLDEKMLMMFDELRYIRQEQVNCSRGVLSLQNSIGKMHEKLGHVIDVTNSQTCLMKTLAYKSIDLEARSRRNNLIFRGFVENREEHCNTIITDFLENRLDIRPTGICINRAHRLGVNRQRGNRPIIVNFLDYSDVEKVMSRVSMLKSLPGISVDFDFPREI
jgi:hypothetical protein